MKIPNVLLNDGHQLPMLGFGTYQIRGAQGIDQILSAIHDGYRSLDSATNYDNEGIVGKAIRESGIPRSQFIVSSKLPGKYHHYDDALDAITESLARMGLDYFDLFLIHWPLPKRDHYVEAWRALITAQKLGLIHTIGVSNFMPEHLDRLINETGVTPAVNQIEIHPYWINEANLQANKDRGIATEAWSPLGRGSKSLKEPIIQKLAKKYDKNTGQIILRWHTQRGVVPIPKSSSLIHQRQNLDIFDFKLTDDEIQAINSLTKPDGRSTNQDPNEYEEFD
ncbi:aldo/keto reductase [Lactobacillus sp. LC28-10]|uniref:Aldo/keto reductase n=1 Tax=Secundilactobacillus angelensis TaxID=2722706 RepID=A0ABX1KVP6_9LACO|nr:aldo/keto reductase [Secundilactobacillus angelensis]MCH5461918.1 aldo/keto reductase [Secundilactobacillus angelensis]NLR17405.1 aldo/keto reductase [Secundilactobacillus angelensis]